MAEKAKSKTAPSFEESFSRLQKLVESLESGELSLSESLDVYAEAIKLSKQCSDQLEAAERKVTLLRETADGEREQVPFPGIDAGEG